jgi:predicted ferric reductase
MSKKEQVGTKVAWGRWCAVAKMMAVILLLIAVVGLVIVTVEYFGTVVASWLVK